MGCGSAGSQPASSSDPHGCQSHVLPDEKGSTKMVSSTMICAGIDIGKANLDVALVATGETIRLANDDQGRKELVGWLGRRQVTRVGLEASGGYERAVCEALRKAKLEVALLQPRQVRAFATYRLKRAKNDRIDALLIAEVTASLAAVRAAPDPRLEGFA